MPAIPLRGAVGRDTETQKRLRPASKKAQIDLLRSPQTLDPCVVGQSCPVDVVCRVVDSPPVSTLLERVPVTKAQQRPHHRRKIHLHRQVATGVRGVVGRSRLDRAVRPGMRATVPGLLASLFVHRPRKIRRPHETPFEILHKRCYLRRRAKGRLRLGALQPRIPQILGVLLIQHGKVARVHEDQIIQHQLRRRLVRNVDHPPLPPTRHELATP